MPPSVEEHLRRIMPAVKDLLRTIEELEDVKSAVLFGSVTRPQDFVVGVSDIDLLVVTSRKPSRRYYNSRADDTEINAVVMSGEELKEAFERGDPLALMVYRSRRVLEDDGTFASIAASKPEVTKHTLRVLRRSVLAALGLALEAYLLGSYRKAVSHAYHSLRHLARYKASLGGVDADGFPLSDAEVEECLAGRARGLFAELAALRRRRDVSREACLRVLSETIKVASLELGLKAPSLLAVERAIGRRANVVVVREVGDSMVVRAEVLTPEGFKKIEVGEGYVREIEDLFD